MTSPDTAPGSLRHRVAEAIRERVAQAIYESVNERSVVCDWEVESESEREAWRGDADVAIAAVLQHQPDRDELADMLDQTCGIYASVGVAVELLSRYHLIPKGDNDDG